MKDLLLFRHAKAEEAGPGGGDIDRPLSLRGRKSAQRMAEHMAQDGVRHDLILCSAALRTRQTLAALLEVYGAQAAVAIEPGLYLADVRQLAARLRAAPDHARSVLIIGHNPGLHELAIDLAERDRLRDAPTKARLARKFATAALARFELRLDTWAKFSPSPAAGAVRLSAYTTPADL